GGHVVAVAPRNDERPRSRGRICPSDTSILALETRRAQGMPGAVAPGSRVQRNSKERTRVDHRYNRTRPAFPARCLTTYSVLSSAYRAFLVTVTPGDHTRGLTPASGCRDHTASSNA